MATPIPDNSLRLSLAEIALATGGQARPGVASEVRGIVTDSRRDVSGKLFVALSGESFDGHAFARAAAERGAAAVLVERELELPSSVSVVRVDSTLAALGALARFHRRRWGGLLVAVGGSAGKTTTKNAIVRALEAAAPAAVHAGKGNLNNLIGVPMVLFGLEDRHRVCVVEVGTNQRGEVARLAAISAPDIAVLTLIAIEHAEGIGSLDAIEAEEGDLLAALGAAGTAIGNHDDPRVRRQLARSPAELRLAYGQSEGATHRITRREPLALGRTRVELTRPRGEPLTLEVPLLGIAGALATAAAVAVADRVAGEPLAESALQAALGQDVAEPGRLVPIELADGSVVIDDSYNANPASVLSALATAREIADQRGARLLLVVGEMRELGPVSRDEHAALGRALADSGAAALIAIGGDAELFTGACAPRMQVEFVPNAERAVSPVLARVQPGDVVLVKASRGIGAERVVAALLAARGRAA